MPESADSWKIKTYLNLVKQVKEECFTISGLQKADSKNALCMIELGYTPSDVFAEVQGLTIENYSQGPLSDEKGRPRDLWVFGKEIEELLIYIKLTVFFESESVSGICVSFHEAEHAMQFPYKEAK